MVKEETKKKREGEPMENVVKLWCGVYGKKTVFSVDIERNGDVEALQKAVAEAMRTKHDTVPPRLLTLCLAKKKTKQTEEQEDNGSGDVWLKHDHSVDGLLGGGKIDSSFPKMRSSWKLTRPELFGLDFQPGQKGIHVLVKLPAIESRPRMTTGLLDDGWTTMWLNEFHNHQLAPQELPRADELTNFLRQELPEKIALPQDLYDAWVAKMGVPSSSAGELMAKLFCIDDAKPLWDFVAQIGSRLVYAPCPDADDSAKSFLSLYDDLIRNVLNFVLSSGKSKRFDPFVTSIGRLSHRPDYVFMVDDVCVFYGKEKDPEHGDKMIQVMEQVETQFVWSDGDAVPYLFGYTAVGFDLRLYALTCVAGDGDDGQHHVDALELAAYDLQDVGDRLKLLHAVLNMARTFKSLATGSPQTTRDGYQTLIGDHGIKVFLEPARVIKWFPEALFQDAQRHVETVYKMLTAHRVAHVDRLVYVDTRTNQIVFEPRGRQDTKPETLGELFQALKNVLEALVKVHAASWMHRDIRGPNVIKTRGDDANNAWFLVDFMDATPSPQASPSGQHLSRGDHAPEIFLGHGSHTTAVDIWSVGWLIQTACRNGIISWYDTDKGRERTQFLELLMHGDLSKRPTAVDALGRLCQLEQEFMNAHKKLKARKAADSTTERKQRKM